MWIGAASILVPLLYLVAIYFFEQHRWERLFGEELRRHNANALQPQKQPLDGRGHSLVRRVADEVISRSGKRAVVLEHGQSGGGIVVHEITATGEFSKRGPYFVKFRPLIWVATGRRHLVETEVWSGFGAGIDTTNPNGGRTKEIGRRILELNTSAHAPMTLRQYARRKELEKAFSEING